MEVFRFRLPPIYYRMKSRQCTLKSRALSDALGEENHPPFVSVSIPVTVPSELTEFLLFNFLDLDPQNVKF
jgi:hypothetical protein